MKTSAYLRLAGIAITSVLLAACGDDNNNDTPLINEMTAEKYELVTASIQRLSSLGEMPSSGKLIISDQTTMGLQVEKSMLDDETMDAMSALDSIFPYDFLNWSLEESDLAFARYYQANTEPFDVGVDGFASLERDASLLMHEQFKAYFTEDEWAGWDQFFTDYPDADGYIRIGNPAILYDSGLALVHVDFICGPYCGLSYFAMFRFENGTWVFKQWYADWVS